MNCDVASAPIFKMNYRLIAVLYVIWRHKGFKVDILSAIVYIRSKPAEPERGICGSFPIPA